MLQVFELIKKRLNQGLNKKNFLRHIQMLLYLKTVATGISSILYLRFLAEIKNEKFSGVDDQSEKIIYLISELFD